MMPSNSHQSNDLGEGRIQLKRAQTGWDVVTVLTACTATSTHLHPVCILVIIACYIPLIKVREKGCHSN